MTLTDLYTILKLSGYPVAYHHFDKPVKPPFIVYLSYVSSNFSADNKVYKQITDTRIELYTDKKDLEAENVLELLLNEHEIPYESDEVYIESERLFQKIYEVRLI